MATLYSDVAGVNAVAVANPTGLICIPFNLTVPLSTLANADVLKLVKIPNFAILTGFVIDIPDLDIHATETITIDVGDDLDPNRYLSGSLLGQDPGRAVSGHAVALVGAIQGEILNTLPHEYAEETGAGPTGVDFQITVSAAVATANTAAVVIKGHVNYTMQKSDRTV